MEKKDKSGLIIGILVGIIIMLVIVIILFVTNTISLGNKFVGTGDVTNDNDGDKTKQIEDTTSSTENLDNDKYASVIDEYRKALNDKNFNDNIDAEKDYPNINTNIIHLHFSYGSPSAIEYVYYDVNGDGKNEMIIGNNTGNIFEMYTYDGSKAVRFYNQSCLGERCNSSIYDNGIVFFYGSGGASFHSLEFYKISSNGYAKEDFKNFSVENDSSGNVIITDNSTKAKTSYKSDNEVISNVVGSAKKVDLSKLSWNEIK